jgi:hypothetical protein
MKALLSPLTSHLSRLPASGHAIAANDATDEEITASNDGVVAGAFAIQQADGLFVPYGEYPSEIADGGRSTVGIQIVDKEAAISMANEMNSFMGKVRSLGFLGRPVFVGHPYHGNKSMRSLYGDKRSRGWVKNIEVGEDGFKLVTSYNELGKREVDDAQFGYHSPEWTLEPVPGRKNAYRPKMLKSTGLTNNPNIPMPPIQSSNEDASNEMVQTPAVMDITKILAALTDAGFIKADDDELTILNSIDRLKEDVLWARERKESDARRLQMLRQMLPTAANEATEDELLESLLSTTEVAAANESQLENLNLELGTLREAHAAARTAHVDAALLPLITSGKVTGADKDAIRAELISAANETAIDERLTQLANQKPKLGTTGGVTDALRQGGAKLILAANEQSARSRQRDEAVNDALAELTAGRKAKSGDKERAWNLAQSRNPALFAR